METNNIPTHSKISSSEAQTAVKKSVNVFRLDMRDSNNGWNLYSRQNLVRHSL